MLDEKMVDGQAVRRSVQAEEERKRPGAGTTPGQEQEPL
jgi:hypothetical protein